MRKSFKVYLSWSRLHRTTQVGVKIQAVAVQQWPEFKLITDLDLRIIKANAHFLSTFNLTLDNSPSLTQLFAESDGDQPLSQQLKYQLQTHKKIQQQLNLAKPDLHFQQMQCQAELIQQPSPHLIWRLQAIPQTFNQAQLNNLTSQIFQQTSAAMLIMDASFNIVSLNPAFNHSTGFSLNELQGKSVTRLCDGQSNTVINQDLFKKLSQEHFYNGELVIARKNEPAFPAHVYIDALQKTEHKVEYYLLSMLDVTAQKQRELELRYYAEVDPLTQLGNRKLLFQAIEMAIASAKRFNYTVAVLFLDLDGFKQVNDHFGHGKGDDVLQEVAQRLQHSVRQVDTVARLGGDEFVVILNGTSKDMIADTALRIIDFLTLSIKDQVTELQVSASIGVSIYPQDSNNPMVLLQYADEAMYKAKEQGKRQFCWHFEPTK